MYLFTFVITRKDGSKGIFECNANTTSGAWSQFNQLSITDIERVEMSYRCAY